MGVFSPFGLRKRKPELRMKLRAALLGQGLATSSSINFSPAPWYTLILPLNQAQGELNVFLL